MTHPLTMVKIERRALQLAQMETVLALPQRAWGGALHALWPHKLPKVVRQRMPRAGLAAWRAVRERAVERRIERHILAMDLMDRQIDAMLERQMMDEVSEELMEEHREQVARMRKAAGSLTRLKKVTITLQNGMTTQFDLDEDEDCEEDIEQGFCMILAVGGSLVLRQQLPLRSQVKTEHGMEWRAQERVYGFTASDGQWRGLTDKEMKRAYTVDQEGNPMEVDPTTSFGDGRALLGKLSALPCGA